MSWSEGRTATPTGAPPERQETLDRVDGLLRALAQDKLLQDDLRHPDVHKALEHWTGRTRLSQDDADELMEDNYRIQSVCDKMAELQSCCKQAGMGLPLSQVLAGKGLYDRVGNSKNSSSNSSSNSGYPPGDLAGSDGTRRPPPASSRASGGGETDHSGATAATGSRERLAARAPEETTPSPTQEEDSMEELTWKRVLTDEIKWVPIVLVCGVVFAVVLKCFKGDDPLGGGGSGSAGVGSGGPDEL